ncbi:hypothetical protein P7C70_g9467, partial [Phenoliferia sp. Uapishka_3]
MIARSTTRRLNALLLSKPTLPLRQLHLRAPTPSPSLSRSSLTLLPFRPLRHSSSSPHPPPASPTTASARWAKLKSLGAPALIIYLAIGLLDFSLTFLLVSAVGADRVREAEDWVLEKLEWRRKDGEAGRIKRAVKGWKESHGGHKESEEERGVRKEKERREREGEKKPNCTTAG